MEECTNQLCKENFLKMNEIARNSNKQCMEYVQYIMGLTEKIEALEADKERLIKVMSPQTPREKCEDVDTETGLRNCLKNCEKDHTWRFIEIHETKLAKE